MTERGDEGATLYLDCDLAEPDVRELRGAGGLGGGRIAVFSARCPGRESANEDAAAVIPFGDASCVLVVADGMGGERAGDRASAIAVNSMRSVLAAAAKSGAPLRGAILDGIEGANEQVRELGVGAATTLAAVEIDGDTVRPYHVGDSTILLVGGRGKLKLQTIAHSPVGFALEAGLLDEVEAMHHEDRHLVSNMLGATDMRIEVGSTRRLAARDTLVLASDGLSDNLHTEEIVAALAGRSLEESAAELAGVARRRMFDPRDDEPSKPDDLTIVLYRRSS